MPKPVHSVHFDDNLGNWLAWGKLVDGWIFNTPPNRPNDAGELEDQMKAPGTSITGIVLGGLPAPLSPADRNRPVNVIPYNNAAGPITIHIPHKNMAKLDKDWLATLGSSAYPLPTFYSAIFGGAALATLSSAVLEEMRKRRVGEYVINECM